MEKLNITDEEARLCRVEDALHDITQQLLASGLPLTQRLSTRGHAPVESSGNGQQHLPALQC